MSTANGEPGLDAQISPGFLPATVFGHTEPTALGVIDLSGDSQLWFTTGLRTHHRDALLLVRLHQDPLGIVHVPITREGLNEARILAVVHEQLGSRIRRHESRFGCRAPSTCCAGAKPPSIPGAVAVIVGTVGRTETLDCCLRSLTALQHAELELIVVDNRPAAQTRELVAKWRAHDRRVRYIAERRPGSSLARNRGVAETRARFVAFTDDDAIVDPNWLAWLLAPFADASVAAVTGMVLPQELETVAQKRFEQYAGFCKGFDRRLYDLRSNRADERLLYPYWGGIFGSGNSMAFRRTEFVAWGGFDPALGPGTLVHSGEDMDAMTRVILRGHRLVYEPRSLCWHKHRRDQNALRHQLYGYGVGLTAALTKALTHDPRFAAAAARSIPVALRIRRQARRRRGSIAALPPELARVEREGMLRGPLLYARSVRAARRERLGAVIAGG
jgi:GT2 family glycosyltransferase